jgi:hypothetical protein
VERLSDMKTDVLKYIYAVSFAFGSELLFDPYFVKLTAV